MQQTMAQIVSVGVYDALPAFNCLRLLAPALVAGVQPGQFLLAHIQEEYGRRPIFPITLHDDGFSALLPAVPPFHRLGPGDEIDCIGSLGKGFPLPAHAHNLLLLAQTTGFGVSERQNGATFLLAFIAQALAAQRNVVLIHEAPTAAQLFPPRALPLDVELRLVTADGSRGHDGAALDLIPELAQWADQIYAVGAPEWYAGIVQALRECRFRVDEGFAWGLIAPEIMPCGLGVCGGCVVETGGGYRQPCVEGPVFDLTRL